MTKSEYIHTVEGVTEKRSHDLACHIKVNVRVCFMMVRVAAKMVRLQFFVVMKQRCAHSLMRVCPINEHPGKLKRRNHVFSVLFRLLLVELKDRDEELSDRLSTTPSYVLTATRTFCSCRWLVDDE
jgi:hypothetical protein